MPLSEFASFNKMSLEEDNSSEAIIDLEVYERSTTDFTNSEIIFGITRSGEEVVLKFSRIPWGPQREWKGLRIAYEGNVPTSRPIALVLNSEGRYGIATERINGSSLYQAPDLIDQFGRIVRNMHDAIKISGEEWISTGKFDFTYYESLIELWRKGNFLDTKETSDARVLLEDFARMVGNNFKYVKPVFNHGDLHNDQVRIDNADELRIIDFEMWQESNPLDDVSMYLLHCLRVNRGTDFLDFIKGYTNNRSLSDQDRMMMSFYLIFSGMRGVDYFLRFKPKKIIFALEQLQTIIQYTKDESLWKDI